MDNNTDRNLVVDVKNLHISFKTFKGYSKVLNGVNLQVHKEGTNCNCWRNRLR